MTTTLHTRTNAAWEAYVAARKQAERTQCIGDGVEAARAFWRFMLEYCPEGYVPPPDLPERSA